MSHTIKIQLSEASIKSGIKQLDDYKKTLSVKCDKLVQRIVRELLVPSIQVNMLTVQYDGMEPNITVTSEKLSEGKWAAVASGENLCFIEFGTGVTYPDDHPKAAKLGMIRGSYGQGKGKQLAWGYYGEAGTNGKVIKSTDKGDLVITHGNPANKPVWNAVKTLSLTKVGQIAQEVFASD